MMRAEITQLEEEGKLLSAEKEAAVRSARIKGYDERLKYVRMKVPALGDTQKAATAVAAGGGGGGGGGGSGGGDAVVDEAAREAAQELERRRQLAVGEHANLVISAERGEQWALDKLEEQQHRLEVRLLHQANNGIQEAVDKLVAREALRVAGDLYPTHMHTDPVTSKSGSGSGSGESGESGGGRGGGSASTSGAKKSSTGAGAKAGVAAATAATFPELRERIKSKRRRKPLRDLKALAGGGKRLAVEEIARRKALSYEEYDNCVAAAARNEEWAVDKLRKQNPGLKEAIESTYAYDVVHRGDR